MKSPLKNVRFNNDCLRYVRGLLPQGCTADSLLFFSGDLELSLAQYDRFIHAHCSLPYVYEFWKCIEHDPHLVHKIVTDDAFKFEDALSFTILQERWHSYEDEFVRAALFFLLNRCSSTGMISSGRLSLENYHPYALNDLKTFKAPTHFHLSFLPKNDIQSFLSADTEADFVLLPVGDFGYNLLEHGKSKAEDVLSVDHRTVRQSMRQSNRKIIALYNYRSIAVDFFEGLNLSLIDRLGDKTKNPQEASEIVVTNF